MSQNESLVVEIRKNLQDWFLRRRYVESQQLRPAVWDISCRIALLSKNDQMKPNENREFDILVGIKLCGNQIEIAKLKLLLVVW